jgi:UDP-N-acetylglucosamine transferase subunit ALG13
MIFATVGTELPFDRMMRVVDEWVGHTGRTDVFAQIGATDWRPTHMNFATFLDPAEFADRFASATTIVSHAGMGTILSALRHQKPIVVMPRRASLGEQRNDHQLATAKWLSEAGKITVAFDEAALRAELDRLDRLHAVASISAFADDRLVDGIRQFIRNGRRSSGGQRF